MGQLVGSGSCRLLAAGSEKVEVRVTRNLRSSELLAMSAVDGVGGAFSVDVPDAEGHAVSFEQFARQQFRPLVGLAYALCGDRSLAPELAQDALLAAFTRWSTVGHLDKPEAWARRVVANRATTTIRRRTVEARATLALCSAASLAPMAGEPRVETEWLWSQVRRLPRRQRQVIALHYVQQLTLEEIASTLGITKASTNTHLRRARATLQRYLRGRDLR